MAIPIRAKPVDPAKAPTVGLTPAAAIPGTDELPTAVAQAGGPPTLTLVHSSASLPGVELRRWEMLKAGLEANTDFSRKYRVVDRLGGGGLGDVIRAMELNKRKGTVVKPVAIKVPKPEHVEDLRERFDLEETLSKQAAAASYYIVPVHTSDEVEVSLGGQYPIKLPYLVMDLVEGVDLGSVIKELHIQKGVSLEKAIKPMIVGPINQVCLGVEDTHNRGIVHLDLKPANILIETIEEKEGGVFSGSEILDQVLKGKLNRTRIVDLGIAQPVDTAVAETIAGTPGYMAPEQALGGKLDRRTDVFALGAVLYNMLTNETPYHLGSNPDDPWADLKAENFRPIPPHRWNKEIPVPLSAIVMKALSHDPSQRYQTAEELRGELTRWARGQPIDVAQNYMSKPEFRHYRIRSWIGYHETRIKLTAGASVFALAGGIGGTYVVGRMLKSLRTDKVVGQINHEFADAHQALGKSDFPRALVDISRASEFAAGRIEIDRATFSPLKERAEQYRRDIEDFQLLNREVPAVFKKMSQIGEKSATPAEESMTKQAKKHLATATRLLDSVNLEKEQHQKLLEFARDLNLGLAIKFVPILPSDDAQQREYAESALRYLEASARFSNLLGEDTSYNNLLVRSHAYGVLGQKDQQANIQSLLSHRKDIDDLGWYLISYERRLAKEGIPAIIDALEEALKINKDHMASVSALGRMKLATGEFEQAAELLQRAADGSPESWSPPMMLGEIYRRKGNSNVETNPEAAERYYLLAVERYKTSRLINSSSNYMAPMFQGMTLASMGELKQQTKDRVAAINYFAEANAVFDLAIDSYGQFHDPSHRRLLYQERGQLLLRRAKLAEPAEAGALYLRALEDGRVLGKLAEASDDLGYYASSGGVVLEAISWLRKNNPNFSSVHDYKIMRAEGLYLKAVGDVSPPPSYAEAERTIQKLIALRNEPTVEAIVQKTIDKIDLVLTQSADKTGQSSWRATFFDPLKHSLSKEQVIATH